MELHPLILAAASESKRVMRNVRSEQLTADTPCRDFDVRALVDHMILWSGFGSELAARKQPMPSDASCAPGHEQNMEDWADRYATQLDTAITAWAEPAAWRETTQLAGTPFPASLAGSLMLVELVVHGWDLAVATGQDLACAEQGRSMGAFGAAVAMPASATYLHHALGLSGRDPHWPS